MIRLLILLLAIFFIIRLFVSVRKTRDPREGFVNCTTIPITFGHSNYICRGKSTQMCGGSGHSCIPIDGPCYSIGKNDDFPNGFANRENGPCHDRPLCSDVASACGLLAIRGL